LPLNGAHATEGIGSLKSQSFDRALTQKKLAGNFGLEPAYISDIERGLQVNLNSQL
jgi:transcriptional regulator with XRE-family HTH domain